MGKFDEMLTDLENFVKKNEADRAERNKDLDKAFTELRDGLSKAIDAWGDSLKQIAADVKPKAPQVPEDADSEK